MYDEMTAEPFRFNPPSAQLNAVLEEYTAWRAKECLCPNCGKRSPLPNDESESVYCECCGYLIALGVGSL
jgi:hypothetical protein